ncbi:MAG: bifunctional uridylate/adenylate kinase [Sarcosagium campestre]|nr:MAG: bifunctional uridylate/adenylate kinase [Sarcosagium campestre]
MAPPPPALPVQQDNSNARLASPERPTPSFSPPNCTVIFVLGGPGAGKGTQCEKLVRDYGLTHMSAGDLLRAEQDREGSEFGELIRNNIKEGIIVPMEVTIALLENRMREVMDTSNGGQSEGKGKFLIDGFPRKMDQALHFDKSVCPSAFTLFFDVPEEVMLQRLLKRAETSGRDDDNLESIKKRFRVFVETSMPVVEHFESQGKVEKVDATPSPDAVYDAVQKVMAKRGIEPVSQPSAPPSSERP